MPERRSCSRTAWEDIHHGLKHQAHVDTPVSSGSQRLDQSRDLVRKLTMTSVFVAPSMTSASTALVARTSRTASAAAGTASATPAPGRTGLAVAHASQSAAA